AIWTRQFGNCTIGPHLKAARPSNAQGEAHEIMRMKRNQAFPKVRGTLCALPVLLSSLAVPALAQSQQEWGLIEQYCMDCHNATDWAGELAFDLIDPNALHQEAETFEKVIRKLRGGLMPPPGQDRPSNEEVAKLATWLA